MKAKRVAKILMAVLVFGTLFIAGFGTAVEHLWNALMPELFGLHAITFWQAVGLLTLSWLLFGGWRGVAGGGPGRRWRRRWEELTPEQRDRLAEAMRARGFAAPGSAGPTPGQPLC